MPRGLRLHNSLSSTSDHKANFRSNFRKL